MSTAASTNGSSSWAKISSPNSTCARASTSTCSTVIDPAVNASSTSGRPRSCREVRRRREASGPLARQWCFCHSMGEVCPSARCSWVASNAVITRAFKASSLFCTRFTVASASAFAADGVPAKVTLLARSRACSRSTNSAVTPGTSLGSGHELMFATNLPRGCDSQTSSARNALSLRKSRGAADGRGHQLTTRRRDDRESRIAAAGSRRSPWTLRRGAGPKSASRGSRHRDGGRGRTRRRRSRQCGRARRPSSCSVRDEWDPGVHV